jgi:hypothetical protein
VQAVPDRRNAKIEFAGLHLFFLTPGQEISGSTLRLIPAESIYALCVSRVPPSKGAANADGQAREPVVEPQSSPQKTRS